MALCPEPVLDASEIVIETGPLDGLIAQTEDLLSQTVTRHLFEASELTDFLLEVRSALMVARAGTP